MRLPLNETNRGRTPHSQQSMKKSFQGMHRTGYQIWRGVTVISLLFVDLAVPSDASKTAPKDAVVALWWSWWTGGGRKMEGLRSLRTLLQIGECTFYPEQPGHMLELKPWLFAGSKGFRHRNQPRLGRRLTGTQTDLRYLAWGKSYHFMYQPLTRPMSCIECAGVHRASAT